MCHDTLAHAAAPYHTRLSATVSFASRVSPPFQGHQNVARDKAHRVDIFLNQPNHRRVSTERLNPVGSQLVASLEGELGPTATAKPFPPSYQVLEGKRKRRVVTIENLYYSICLCVYAFCSWLKKHVNASKRYEHPPDRGKKCQNIQMKATHTFNVLVLTTE